MGNASVDRDFKRFKGRSLEFGGQCGTAIIVKRLAAGVIQKAPNFVSCRGVLVGWRGGGGKTIN